MIVKYGSTKPYNCRTYSIPLKNRLILSIKSKTDYSEGLKTSSHSIKAIFLAIYKKWSLCFLAIFMVFSLSPITANAGIISTISSFFSGNSDDKVSEIDDSNSQNVPLLQSAVNFDLKAAVGGGEINTVGDVALVSESGPSGTLADIEDTVSTGQISTYTVRKGDTLSSIAKMYGINSNTIVWANELKSSSVKEGQQLVILPVIGTIHTVVKGDTLASIAKKYKADEGEIAQFNDISSDSPIAIGDTIIIPDGEGTTKISAQQKSSNSGSRVFVYHPYKGGSGPDLGDYYMRPVVGGVRTQGLHGYNSIDIGIPTGSTLYAAAAGQVILAKSSGYNGGYGKYIIISHYNGTQTVYGHLSQVNVNVGDAVYKGQIIGRTGNTGRSTGPHLHFEVRGALNPLSK